MIQISWPSFCDANLRAITDFSSTCSPSNGILWGFTSLCEDFECTVKLKCVLCCCWALYVATFTCICLWAPHMAAYYMWHLVLLTVICILWFFHMYRFPLQILISGSLKVNDLVRYQKLCISSSWKYPFTERIEIQPSYTLRTNVSLVLRKIGELPVPTGGISDMK